MQRERKRDRNRETGQRTGAVALGGGVYVFKVTPPTPKSLSIPNWLNIPESQSAELRSSVEVSLVGHRTKWRRLDSESTGANKKISCPPLKHPPRVFPSISWWKSPPDICSKKNKESSLIVSLWIYQPIYLIGSTVQMYSDSDHFSPRSPKVLLWSQHHPPFTTNSSTSTLDSVWNFKHSIE